MEPFLQILTSLYFLQLLFIWSFLGFWTYGCFHLTWGTWITNIVIPSPSPHTPHAHVHKWIVIFYVQIGVRNMKWHSLILLYAVFLINPQLFCLESPSASLQMEEQIESITLYLLNSGLLGLGGGKVRKCMSVSSLHSEGLTDVWPGFPER